MPDPKTRRFVIVPDTPPDRPGMMLATLDALRALGGSATIDELNARIAEIEGVTPAEHALQGPTAGRPRLSYYLAWARTTLKRGRAISNPSRGLWALTPEGARIQTLEQTRELYMTAHLEWQAEQKAKRATTKESEVGTKLVDPQEQDEPDDEDDWRSELLKVLGTIAPDAFERLAQRLLREAGFTKVEVLGKTGDGGIDGVGLLRVNLVSFPVYLQCKRWKGTVGAKDIRDFRGALQGRADKGLFITTGSFSTSAWAEATRDGAISIDLVDGERLCDLLKTYRLGVETKQIEVVQILPNQLTEI